ncbi:NEDD8-activating enzyme E1 regulatory subunit axr1 [Castilleja foliolosa]|uniref:NEDD8-activating enzyme E1 regulatory subunit axr1 n=1 Tax=Castilleja foliolosa TaxID=1961234 RepID=A0ABD3BDW0_9LAMI
MVERRIFRSRGRMVIHCCDWAAAARTSAERGGADVLFGYREGKEASKIWGEQGQTALEKSSICLLNCGPTGPETLRNLVLGSVGSVTIVDGSKVELGDLGNNFMGLMFGTVTLVDSVLVDEPSVGQSKAKTVCVFLEELNDAVKAKFIEEYPEKLIDSSPSLLRLVEHSMVKLDKKICLDANVMLIFARSYGLTGFVRINVKEHAAIESKPDHFLDDLRLNNPWSELRRDLHTSDPVIHKHTPYVIILIKMADDWAKAHDGNLPSTREEKKVFKDLIKAKMIASDEDNFKEAIETSFKVFSPQGIILHVITIPRSISKPSRRRSPVDSDDESEPEKIDTEGNWGNSMRELTRAETAKLQQLVVVSEFRRSRELQFAAGRRRLRLRELQFSVR